MRARPRRGAGVTCARVPTKHARAPGPPIRELLTPHGGRRGAGRRRRARRASFVRYGSGAHALVGAILCPALACCLRSISGTASCRTSSWDRRLSQSPWSWPSASGTTWSPTSPRRARQRHPLRARDRQPGRHGPGRRETGAPDRRRAGLADDRGDGLHLGRVIVLALELVVATRRAGLKAKIAFGPLLALGARYRLFYGIVLRTRTFRKFCEHLRVGFPEPRGGGDPLDLRDSDRADRGGGSAVHARAQPEGQRLDEDYRRRRRRARALVVQGLSGAAPGRLQKSMWRS